MSSWRAVVGACAAAIACAGLALAPPAAAAPGDLDSGFAAGGLFTSPLQSGQDTTTQHAVALDAQGRTLFVHAKDDDDDNQGDALVVGRLTTGGALDTTFNPGGATPGLVEVDLGPDVTADQLIDAKGVVPGPDGTVYALAAASGIFNDVVLVRLTSDGALDGGFGTGGRIVDTSRPGYSVLGDALAVDGQGRALVAGKLQDAMTFLTVTRYTTGGQPDGSWGSGGDGRARFSQGGENLRAHAIQALADGRVVVAGEYGDDVLAARFTAGGDPDDDFGDAGIATSDFGRYGLGNAWGYAVAVDSQGRVLVGGFSYIAEFTPVGVLGRFTAAGEVDASFGSGGPATGAAYLPASMRRVDGLRIGCADRVLVAGMSRVSLDANLALARFTAAGVVDTAFAPGEPEPGVVVTDLGASDLTTGLAVDAQARAYVSGVTHAAPSRFVVMRRLDTTGCAPGEQPPEPPRPPTDPPAGGGGGGGAGGGSLLAARLAGPARAGGLSLTTLDASGSTGAARYRWDVNGDGRDDIGCGADQPLATVRLASAVRSGSSVNVRLTAIGPGGATSTTSRAIAVATSTTAQRSAASVMQPLACASDRTITIQRHTCVNEKVDFGTTSAAGCFLRVAGRDEVPSGERPILDAAVAYYNENQRRRTYVWESCREVFQRDCFRRTNEITRREVDPLLTASDLRIAYSTVRINGLEFIPQAGATIAVFPQIGRVVSSNAIVKFGDATVPLDRRVNLDVEGSGPIQSSPFRGGARITVVSFKPNIPFADLAGFSLDGEVKLDFVDGGFDKYAEASFRLALPDAFAVFDGNPPSGSVLVRADNESGVQFDDVDLRVPQAELGGLRFSDVRFHYTRSGADGCPAKYWKATATVYLGLEDGDAGFRLAPDPPQNGVAFCQGGFKSAGGEFTFGGSIPPPQLFPGVSLKAINFATQLDPTLVRGGATITASDITEVKGSVLAIFASPGAPYVLSKGDAVGGLEPLGALAGRRLQSQTIAMGGTFGFSLPAVGRVDFGKGYWLYAYPDYVALGGDVLIPAPGVVMTAGLSGEMGIASRQYSFRGFGRACVAGGISSIGCIGGEAWVTSKGLVVCGDIAGEIHPGVGYKWGDTFPEIWLGPLGDGCKPSGYWLDAPVAAGARAAADGGRTFTVRPGHRSVRVRIVGTGGAPSVVLRGPDGEAVSTAGDEYVESAHFAVLRHLPTGVTWAGIRNAKPGTYSVEPVSGSPAIASVATSQPVGAPRVSAKVRGAGARRTLTYRLSAAPRGQQVTFFERGASTFRRLGVARGRAGTLRFKPDAATRGTRTIVARVEVRGYRVSETTVARHRVVPPRLGRPGKLRVVRRGRAVRVSWSAAPGAKRYGVVVSPALGAQRILRTTRRSIRLPGAVAARGGTLQVTALDALGNRGRSRTARWRPTARRADRFLPYRELHTGTARRRSQRRARGR